LVAAILLHGFFHGPCPALGLADYRISYDLYFSVSDIKKSIGEHAIADEHISRGEESFFEMLIGSKSMLSVVLALVLVAGAIPTHGSATCRSDEIFMKDALRRAKVEAQLGKMAASKAADPDLKDFARQTVRDNSTISRQLERIARNEGIPTGKVKGRHQNEIINRLSKLNGFGFDQAYLHYEVEKLEDDLGCYREEIEHGSSAGLKNFAADTAPKLETRMKTAKRIMEEQLLRLLLIDP
jgi:putative membrane protein